MLDALDYTLIVLASLASLTTILAMRRARLYRRAAEARIEAALHTYTVIAQQGGLDAIPEDLPGLPRVGDLDDAPAPYRRMLGIARAYTIAAGPDERGTLMPAGVLLGIRLDRADPLTAHLIEEAWHDFGYEESLDHYLNQNRDFIIAGDLPNGFGRRGS